MDIEHRKRAAYIEDAIPRSLFLMSALMQTGIDEYDSIDALAFLIIGIKFAKNDGLPEEEIEAMCKQVIYHGP